MGEGGVGVSDENWENGLKEIHHCSVNSSPSLIQFQIIHRLHYFPSKLHHIFRDTSPICDKCNTMEATLLHSFALCPNLHYCFLMCSQKLLNVT